LATLKRMFRLATQSTPPKLSRIPYIPMLREDNARSAFVEDAEYERLTANATELWLRTFLELAYSYGWRRGELLGLRVRQVNFANRSIRLDPGTTKNKEGREVAMTAKVAELLREALVRKRPDDYVLTRNGKPVKEFRRTWGNLCERAGLGQFLCTKCGEPVPGGGTCKRKLDEGEMECVGRRPRYRGLIPHDLRRSAAKAARRAGVPESVVMKMGGWKTAAMFRRYAIDSSSDQRAAVEMLERARAAALAPETALLLRSSLPLLP
jgi:integrase